VFWAKKVLAKSIDCGSLAPKQKKALGARCEFKPQVLVQCESVVGAHTLGDKCAMGGKVLVECSNSLIGNAHCELSDHTISLLHERAPMDPCDAAFQNRIQVEVDCPMTPAN